MKYLKSKRQATIEFNWSPNQKSANPTGNTGAKITRPLKRQKTHIVV